MSPHFDSETALQDALHEWFMQIGLPCIRHPALDNGSVPDFGLLIGDQPWGLIEVKKGLDYETFRVKDAADYFEQCLKYRVATGLPVFLGPFFVRRFALSHFFTGGAYSRAVAAFSALAGRADVGLFFVQQDVLRKTASWSGICLTMRQQKIGTWSIHGGESVWPKEQIKMVGMNNAASKKVRE